MPKFPPEARGWVVCARRKKRNGEMEGAKCEPFCYNNRKIVGPKEYERERQAEPTAKRFQVGGSAGHVARRGRKVEREPRRVFAKTHLRSVSSTERCEARGAKALKPPSAKKKGKGRAAEALKAPNEEALKTLPKKESPKEEPLKEEAPRAEAPNEGTSTEESPKVETPKEAWEPKGRAPK